MFSQTQPQYYILHLEASSDMSVFIFRTLSQVIYAHTWFLSGKNAILIIKKYEFPLILAWDQGAFSHNLENRGESKLLSYERHY